MPSLNLMTLELRLLFFDSSRISYAGIRDSFSNIFSTLVITQSFSLVMAKYLFVLSWLRERSRDIREFLSFLRRRKVILFGQNFDSIMAG